MAGILNNKRGQGGVASCDLGGIDYARLLALFYCRGRGSSMDVSSPLIRQWILLRILSARHYGATVKELAEELTVSEKTIRRDLEVFQTAGFPLEETIEDFGRKKWKLQTGANPPGISLLWDEAAALYLGQRFLEPLAGTPFWEAAQRAFKKIRATLGEGSIKYMENFATLFHKTMVGVSDYSKKAEIVDQLMLGIEDHRAVFIAYQSLQATESVTYDVYPFGLAYHRGSLYLVGRKPEKPEISHWKVDRISEAEITEIHFQPPEDFDLSKHLSSSFGIFQGDGNVTVKIRFSPTVARYVQESQWHASQKLTAQRDGSLLAEFDLDGTEEIKRWILSFGQHAEVLEPEELQKSITKDIHNMLSTYSGSRPSTSKRQTI